jgi:hypothetical protein
MKRNKKESRIVMTAPTYRGHPVMIVIAVADPTTSYMSDPIMASSVMIQRVYFDLGVYCSLQF